MKMSTKGRYALTTMMYLANHYSDEKYVSLKEISDSEGISFKYLEKIVNNLNKNNYLDVQRGNNGGYKLKKKPEEYVIGDILRVSEGNLAPIECLTKNSNCFKKNDCKMCYFWKGLYDQINNYVDSITLKDLINGGKNE